MRAGSLLSAPVALFILLCFFLPWVSVSCMGEDVITFTGMDLAAGKEFDLGFASERTDGELLLFVVPGAALVSFFLALSTLSRDNSADSAGLQLLLALLAIGILVVRGWEMFDAATSSRSGMVGMNVGFHLKVGLWGTAGGLVALVVGAIMTLGDRNAAANARAAPLQSPEKRQGAVPAAAPALGCVDCGEPFAHQVKFCPKCGAKQPAVTGRE